jgi:hypothetical protein
MLFNGAVSNCNPTTSPGRYSGEDNGWALSLMYAVLIEFNQTIIKYPNVARAGRCIERPGAEPDESGEPGAGDGSEEPAKRQRGWRLTARGATTSDR